MRFDYTEKRVAVEKAYGEKFETLIVRKYVKEEMSCPEIVEELAERGFKYTPKTIERVVVKVGKLRPVGDAYRLAAKRGRIKWAVRDDRVTRHDLRTSGLRFKIMERDGFKCVLCGATAQEKPLEIDHIKPLIEGGTDDETNLRTLCRVCNVGKRMAHKEWHGAIAIGE